MRITATRRLQYAIGHRVFGHEGKCRHLHGHNFVFFLTAEGAVNEALVEPALDPIGRVIDFGVLKQKLGTWIETAWDHGFVIWDGDLEANAALAMIPGQKVYRLPTNPTAENLARYLLGTIGPELLAGTGVHLTKVTVWETENGIAEASE